MKQTSTNDNPDHLSFKRTESKMKLQATWESIIIKYSNDFKNDDIIDLLTETLLVDNNHIRKTPVKKFGDCVEMVNVEMSPLGV